MNLQAGITLKSTAALKDTIFADAVIFLTEYNEGGAVGFIINRPFNRSLNELQEFKWSPAFPLFEGGPVDHEHVFFLHRRPDIIQDGTPVGDGVFWSGNFRQAVNGINNKMLSSTDIKIFVGYCGWDTGELEAEIVEGSWIVTQRTGESVFE